MRRLLFIDGEVEAMHSGSSSDNHAARRRLISLVIAASALNVLAPRFNELLAQQLEGRVIVRGVGSPIAGAVAAIESQSGRMLSSVVTDSLGQFRIRLMDSVATLRVRRLGFRPLEHRISDLTVAGASGVVLEMERLPAELGSIVVSARPCASPRTEDRARPYWEQARSAFLAAAVARAQIPADYDVLTYDRHTQGEREVERVELMSRASAARMGIRSRDTEVTFDQGWERYPPPPGTTTEFVTRFERRTAIEPWTSSRTPDVFAREGYFVARPGQFEFFAPTADVLSDSSFVATHCFRIAPDDRSRPGQIGIAFAPSLGRAGIPEIRGTLWLDRAPLKVRSMDFVYTGPGAAARDKSGGRLHFAEGPNGVVVLEAWAIWYPVSRPRMHSVSRGVDTANGRVVVMATSETADPWIHEIGSLLIEARWRDGTHLKRPIPGIVGRVIDGTTSRPRPGVHVSIPGGGRSSITDARGEFKLDTMIHGAFTVVVLDTAIAEFGLGRWALPAVVRADTTANAMSTVRMGTAYQAVRRRCGILEGTEAGIVAVRALDSLGAPIVATIRASLPGGTHGYQTVDSLGLVCAVGKGTLSMEVRGPGGELGRVTRQTPGRVFFDTVTVVVRVPRRSTGSAFDAAVLLPGPCVLSRGRLLAKPEELVCLNT